MVNQTLKEAMNTTPVSKPTLNGLNELYKFLKDKELNVLVLVNGSIETSLTKIEKLKDFYNISNSNGKTIISVSKKFMPHRSLLSITPLAREKESIIPHLNSLERNYQLPAS